MTFPVASETTIAETVRSGCVTSKRAVVEEASATELIFSSEALPTILMDAKRLPSHQSSDWASGSQATALVRSRSILRRGETVPYACSATTEPSARTN